MLKKIFAAIEITFLMLNSIPIPLFLEKFTQFFQCTVKVKGSKNIINFLKILAHVAQNLRNFAHVSDFKNIAPFGFYLVFKVLTF